MVLLPSKVSIPVRSDGQDDADAGATFKLTKPMEPVEAFDQQVLRDFELWLTNRKGCQALTAHKRSYLRMILDPNYTISRLDQLGVEKSKDEIKREHSTIWRMKAGWELDEQNQVMRLPTPKEKFAPRIAACLWDASTYIVNRHRQLGHPGYKKTFESLQQDVYGIQRQEVKWLIERCLICNNKNSTNTKAPLIPIVASRAMERLQIDMIDMRHIPDGGFKWIYHIKDHFLKFSALL